METYQKIILFILVLIIISSLVLFLKKRTDNQTQDKDKNLKIAITLINKENYEDMLSNNISQQCSKMLSLLGDSNNKGLNNIYEDITRKESPVKLPIDCSKMTVDNFYNITQNMLMMINEMILKAIENEDKEKGYNDLIALYLIVIKKLVGVEDKINVFYDTKGKIEAIEIIHRDTPVTIEKMIDNNINTEPIEPQGRKPEITDMLNKTKARVQTRINPSDLDRFKGDTNSKIKVYDFGIILSHIISKRGSFLL